MAFALDEAIGWFVITLPDRTGSRGDVFPFPDEASAARFSVTARLVTPEVYLCQVRVGPALPQASPRDVPFCAHPSGWCRGRPVGGSWTDPAEHRAPPPPDGADCEGAD
jgi:hypothetical protein